MGSRDRPHREAKKKPKDKGVGLPKIQPLSEPPTNVELIRKPRKPRTEDEDQDEG